MSNENQVEKINLKSLPMGQTKYLSYDLETEWIQTILKDVQEGSTPDPQIESSINIDLEITRLQTPKLGEYLTVEGGIKSIYQVPCVRCLENGIHEMDIEFSVCVLDEELGKKPWFEELDSYVIDDEEYQLYYTENRQFNLQLCIHEQYFMNTKYLPLHDENCLGLCTTCGTNKNLETCKHTNIQ